MDAKKTLIDFKKKLDPEIEEYFGKVIAEAEKKDIFIKDALKYAKKLVLAGGKRIRPAFMYYAFLGAGGAERAKILKASISIELVHTFLLIHDDIIDRDRKRHGIDTVNVKYQKMAENLFPKKDASHFGNSIAIIVGDMICAMGNQIIYESTFDPQLIVRALYKLQSIVSMTVIGEAKDVYIEYRRQATEREVMKMYEYKTAKYTFEGPLHLGAILAGASDKMLATLSAYAVPMGIAFQIRDDILGIFGNKEKLGKPVGSDIIGGKQTLLVVKASEFGNRNQKRTLDKYLGRRDLAMSEIEEFRKVIIETGALKYAEVIANKLIEKGKKAIEKEKIKAEAKDFLIGIADYMVNREV